jgi:hypothetical protein
LIANSRLSRPSNMNRLDDARAPYRGMSNVSEMANRPETDDTTSSLPSDFRGDTSHTLLSQNIVSRYDHTCLKYQLLPFHLSQSDSPPTERTVVKETSSILGFLFSNLCQECQPNPISEDGPPRYAPHFAETNL